MIKEILQEAITKLTNERQSAINAQVNINLSTTVQPKCNEIELAKNEKIKEIQAEANAKICAITEAAANAKSEFEEQQKSAIQASVGAKYDVEIANLSKQLETISE